MLEDAGIDHVSVPIVGDIRGEVSVMEPDGKISETSGPDTSPTRSRTAGRDRNGPPMPPGGSARADCPTEPPECLS
ncbi:hypothetical protein GCM10010306_094710 [Streptomyces umbrinus]|nr:hypothetical protein GCM10010306_094710 [Streptomyces umbrinus]